MSNKPAFAEAIRILVAKEVHEALAPYREALASLVEFAGGNPAGAPAGSPAGAAPQRRGRRPAPSAGPRASAASAEVVGRFSEGQRVQYRQGRGTFDAKVVAVDGKKGLLTLEREGDQKKVIRPASKVLAA